MTFTFDGDYTEFKDKNTGTAMYMSRVDMAGYENGWLPLPAQAKTMILGKMEQSMSREMGGVDRLVRDRVDFYVSQMPKSMSLRFSWPFLSAGAKGMEGEKPKKSKADCPNSKTCEKTVVSIEGNTFEFSYSNFDIRRPSGW